MQPGDSLDGRYTIVSRLGAGGMGEVYKATHNFLNATRVIKIIHPTISGRQDAHDRFLKEARIATKVQHPNVATLHDFASLPDGAHYMVWEYIDGENLAQRLRTRGTLPPRQAVRIALQALRGLEAIHAAGIIHRDISPENLMITADDTVKIIDLGVAKIEDPDEVAQTRTGIFVGKLRYAAPEQLGFLPDNEKIDGRTDLYAMAMVLVELLTGRPPYEAKSPHEYFLHHAREVQQRTTVELPAQLPASSALRDVLEKALERDRNQRYPNARAFATALEEIEKTLPTAVDTPTMAVPLDGDETLKLRATKAGTTAPGGATPPPPPLVAVPTAVGQTMASGAPTLQTPLPGAAIPPARTRSGFNPVFLIIGLVLLFAVAAGAVVVMKPMQLLQRITGSKPTDAPTTTSAAALPAPSQTTIDATPDPQVTEATTSPELSAPVVGTIAQTDTSRDVARPEIKPRQTDSLVPAPDRDADEEKQAEYQQEQPQQPSRVRAVAVYVDASGNTASNERALERLRNELRGVSQVALHAGALQVQVYRAIHRYLPELEFDEESDVVITFDSTPQRLSLDKNDLAARVSIEKGGRPIFSYELPRHYDRSQAAEAFARTLAEAFSE